jgi:hypothetical protein
MNVCLYALMDEWMDLCACWTSPLSDHFQQVCSMPRSSSLSTRTSLCLVSCLFIFRCLYFSFLFPSSFFLSSFFLLSFFLFSPFSFFFLSLYPSYALHIHLTPDQATDASCTCTLPLWRLCSRYVCWLPSRSSHSTRAGFV